MQTEQYTVLTADEGKFLTQVAEVAIDRRIIATKVALGRNDSAANWREITADEADTLRQLQLDAEQARAEAEAAAQSAPAEAPAE